MTTWHNLNLADAVVLFGSYDADAGVLRANDGGGYAAVEFGWPDIVLDPAQSFRIQFTYGWLEGGFAPSLSATARSTTGDFSTGSANSQIGRAAELGAGVAARRGLLSFTSVDAQRVVSSGAARFSLTLTGPPDPDGYIGSLRYTTDPEPADGWSELFLDGSLALEGTYDPATDQVTGQDFDAATAVAFTFPDFHIDATQPLRVAVDYTWERDDTAPVPLASAAWATSAATSGSALLGGAGLCPNMPVSHAASPQTVTLTLDSEHIDPAADRLVLRFAGEHGTLRIHRVTYTTLAASHVTTLFTPILFPDIEMWATGYLRAALADHGYSDVHVSNRRENQDRAVWVRRDGGSSVNAVMEKARIGINVYAKGATDETVSQLARTVAALLRAAPDGKPVCAVDELMGPSPIPDTLPRRYMTFELTVRGLEL